MPGLYNLLLNKYKLDEFYYGFFVDGALVTAKDFLWKIVDVKIVDGVINGAAKVTLSLSGTARKLQTGLLQNYALLMALGIVIILGAFILL